MALLVRAPRIPRTSLSPAQSPRTLPSCQSQCQSSITRSFLLSKQANMDSSASIPGSARPTPSVVSSSVSHFALAPRLQSNNCLGSLLYICWFDRGGLIGSSAIDVSKDLERYLVLLFILQRFKDDEWGRLAALDDSAIYIRPGRWMQRIFFINRGV